MKGGVEDICKGLDVFHQRSGSSITILELEMIPQAGSTLSKTQEIQLLFGSLGPSLARFEFWLITRSGYLALVPIIAFRVCSRLKVFKFINDEETQGFEAIDLGYMSSQMELEEFVWHRGLYDLDYEAIEKSIPYFQKLRKLEIHSNKATEDVLIKFLTGCSKLETVIFPQSSGCRSLLHSLDIPKSQAPSLKYLELSDIPSNLFLKFHPPNLKVLKITTLYCSELRSLASISSLEELAIKTIRIDSETDQGLSRALKSDKLGEVESAGLLQILSKATSLKILRLQLRAYTTTYRFWESLISSMTPLSSFNARKGAEDQPFIMPKLEVLELGNGSVESSPSTQTNELKLDSEITAGVVSLIAARKFASQGFSKSSICLAANGFVEDVEEQFGNSESPYCQYSAIKDLSFQVKIKSNQKSVEWLKDNVQRSDLSGFWWDSEE